MREPKFNSTTARLWTTREAYLLALICLASGLVLGYLFRGSSSPAVARVNAPAPPASEASVASPPVMPPTAGAPALSGAALEPFVAPLISAAKADPKNADGWAQVGNLYYDHKDFTDAITYYKRALEIRPNDVNVRTDLGTAYWYSGSAEKAIAEYEKALTVQPGYAQTLLNLGIVRMEGLKDNRGAIAAWQKLLAANPQFPEKERVLALISQAQSQGK
jgi:cytochrome c-type biogenesis protein CcmH/NrfG